MADSSDDENDDEEEDSDENGIYMEGEDELDAGYSSGGQFSGITS
jgi:hypothetical protein